MDLGLTDRVFLVTGGARGLGRATADVLVDEGARVVLSGRSEESLAAAAEALGDHASYVVADNADPGAPAALLAEARRRWGRVDGALVSVGGPPTGPVTAITDEQWTTSFEAVFLGAVRMAREVAAALGDGGSLALVLSTSVRGPLTDMAISNGLRPGLAMLTKQLADELGPRGVRVNGLHAGSGAHRAGRRARRDRGRPRGRRGGGGAEDPAPAATASRQSSAVPRRSCSAPPRRS